MKYSFIAFGYLILLLFQTTLVEKSFASESNKLKSEKNGIYISPTFSLHLPQEKFENIFLPSLNSNYIKLQSENGKMNEIFIQRISPPTYATKSGIERLWRNNRRQIAYADLKEKNENCNKIKPRVFQCLRSTIQNHKFVTEGMIWNAKNDLVTIRVNSSVSAENSKSLFKSLIINVNSRLPASGDSK